MCLDLNCQNEQDILNMFKAYIKLVVVNSRRKYDKTYYTRLQHEELTLSADTQGFAINDTNRIDSSFSIDDCCKVDFSNIEAIFSDDKLYMTVKTLTLKQKKVLHLIYIECKSEQDVANILHLTRQGVNKLKNTALRNIADQFFRKNN